MCRERFRFELMLASLPPVPCIINFGAVSSGSDRDGIWARHDQSKARTSDVWSYQ
ncbi:hypothetical protein SABIM44S_00173 [Streptomyces abikoensis]